MTGYGRSVLQFQGKTIAVEIRSLNSKYTDVRLKIPQNYKEKEHILRKEIIEQLERGKIDLIIEVTSLNGEEGYGLNRSLFKTYYKELTSIATELSIPTGDIMSAILRIPNVVVSPEGTVQEEEWENVQLALKNAIKEFMSFRRSEGNALKQELVQRIQKIIVLLDEVLPHEKDRFNSIRLKLQQRLDEFMSKEEVDKNRFEQEVLFYLEKIDLTEEKVRLIQHCNYFIEELEHKSMSKGRKLGFISQELGREMNTMGAKAYSHEIQRIVVTMKDELEKIKEQLANIV
ncbi:MAG: YicC family protein [Saprospiraceae bacterium]|nr:YicC family protein [Saprospiraceae bacterium]